MARAKAKGLVAVEGRDESGGPELDEASGERIELVQPNVGIVLADAPSSIHHTHNTYTSGTLYITTRQVIWLSDSDPDKGYAADFLSLAMHAISTDVEAYPLPCIYTQIESEDTNVYDINGDGDDEFEEELEVTGCEELSKISEMRLVPADSNALERIFQVLCACAALNPDPESGQEGEGDWFFNEDEVLAGGLSDISITSEHEIAEEPIQDSRFEDAEEEEELEDG